VVVAGGGNQTAIVEYRKCLTSGKNHQTKEGSPLLGCPPKTHNQNFLNQHRFDSLNRNSFKRGSLSPG